MKVLIVLSSRDFDNFTRRATVEAICEQHPDTTLLFFNGVKGFPIRTPSNKQLSWKAYYSMSLGKGRNALRKTELSVAGLFWKPFIRSFDTVFLTDPNQELILDYMNESQKLLYLIRDPNVLLSKNNYWKEKLILSKNPHVFGISKALCNDYLKDYYPDVSLSYVTYWPNTVDLKVWDYEKYKHRKTGQNIKIVGVIGNITAKSDLDLLYYLSQEHSDVQFEIYGRNQLKGTASEKALQTFDLPNINYKGYVPFEQVPEIVINWCIGLVIERLDMEFARYYDANKRYQYVSMGIPFVSYYYNDECEKFGTVAYTATTKERYSQKISEALKASGDKNLLTICLQKAQENSSEVRARQLIKHLHKE